MMKMPVSLTDEQLEAIRKRAEAATPGPWLISPRNDDYKSVLTSDEIIAESIYDYDAEFIAHAREDVPALLAEIDRLNGLLRILGWGDTNEADR